MPGKRCKRPFQGYAHLCEDTSMFCRFVHGLLRPWITDSRYCDTGPEAFRLIGWPCPWRPVRLPARYPEVKMAGAGIQYISSKGDDASAPAEHHVLAHVAAGLRDAVGAGSREINLKELKTGLRGSRRAQDNAARNSQRVIKQEDRFVWTFACSCRHLVKRKMRPATNASELQESRTTDWLPRLGRDRDIDGHGHGQGQGRGHEPHIRAPGEGISHLVPAYLCRRHL